MCPPQIRSAIAAGALAVVPLISGCATPPVGRDLQLMATSEKQWTGIAALTVITALEGPIAPMICASDAVHDAEACQRAGFCNVERLWQRVRAAIVQALDSMTLRELAVPAPGHPAHPEPALVAVQPRRCRNCAAECL